MAYLSALIGKPVTDVDGVQVGVLCDLVARQAPITHHPIIEAVVVCVKNQQHVLPYQDVAVLISSAIPLKHHLEDISPFVPSPDDIFLKRDVMDKQIIDTDGARVVRVNDIELVRINGSIFVSNVDIGVLGILRRVGMGRKFEALLSWFKFKITANQISWDYVEPLIHDQFMRLKVPVARIHDLHPADVAEIISDLNQSESGQLLESLDIEHLADALEEVEPDFQATLVESMSDEKVADVLEEMSPDEAADLLAELPKERSEDLLEMMDDQEADEVRRLLAYPEDSAGGLMTTELATVRPGLSAGQAIDVLRTMTHVAETVFYVYVTDEEGHLIGVFSLSDLIFSSPETPVAEFMHKKVVSANVQDGQDELAQLVAKYNLLAIPIVDDSNLLLGMVTADDALDKIIPTAWKKRLPRFYLS